MCRFSSDIVSGEFKHRLNQNHTVFFYDEDSGELYVGGTDFVLKLDVDNYHFTEVGVSLQHLTSVSDSYSLFSHTLFSLHDLYHVCLMAY